MSAINAIQIHNYELNLHFSEVDKDYEQSNTKIRSDEFKENSEDENSFIYKKISDGLSRPIKINSSNSTFFINHNAQNKAIKIEAGEYNLRELQTALKKKVNEKFGINQISLQLTAAGKDRFIYAEDKKQDKKIDLEA
jgi:hypothetical protein